MGRRPAVRLQRHRRPAPHRRQGDRRPRPRASRSTRCSSPTAPRACSTRSPIGKITGEEDRYSHTDLYDFDENVKGSKAAIDALRPAIKARDAALLTKIDAGFAALDTELDKYRTDSGFQLYTELSKDQVKALSVAVDAVSEDISKVAGVVAGT